MPFMLNPDDHWVACDVKTAADRCGFISHRQILWHIRKGNLRAGYISGRIRIMRDDLEAFKKECGINV